MSRAQVTKVAIPRPATQHLPRLFFVYNCKTSQSNLVRSAYTRCRGGNGSESRVNNALNLKTLKAVPTAAM